MQLTRSLLTAAAAVAIAAPLHGQGRVSPPPPPTQDSVTAAPGPRYPAGGLHELLLGSTWRDLWATPITVPVLDIDTFAGGIEPVEEGGGRQSITLHFEGRADDREWIFRSVDKYPEQKLDVGGLAEFIVQDQVSALHPAGQLVIPPLLDALGLLHVEPTLYVMPDDASLGEFRERFAGMIGALELKPNEGEDDTPGFAGSSKVVGHDEMLERLEDTPVHRVDQREVLRSRLFDFVIGDTDRASDQWRWARFPHPEHADRYLWRPVPRDRDWAFVGGNGGLTRLLAASIYPKYVRFGPEHASLEAQTFSAHLIDRNMLTELGREAFVEEVATIRSALSDGVLAAAVARLPASYPDEHRRYLLASLKSRRDTLEPLALEFFEWLATEVDVRGTDLPDRAEVDRRPDGSVEVTLRPRPEALASAASSDGDDEDDGDPRPATTAPYFHRIFLPAETDEVRIYLHGGDDVAVVRGGPDAIDIRLIGGGGDDVLADSSGAGGVYLYDDRGDNVVLEADGTAFSDVSWDPPPTPEGARLGSDWSPDWGGSRGWGPVIDWGEEAGLVVGFGPRWTDYSFRRMPYHWSVRATPLVALGTGEIGLQIDADYRFESSMNSLELEARWAEFEALRWHGLGNDSELVPQALSLVPLRSVSIQPALVLRFGRWHLESDADIDRTALVIEDETPSALRAQVELGPVAAYVEPSPAEGSPLARRPLPGADGLWQAGGRLAAGLWRLDSESLPRSGFRLRAAAEGYPAALDVDGRFADLRGQADGYLPLVGSSWLALRLGGMRALGAFPAWHAATLGGRATLRGFEFQRFAGDAAAYGAAELRLPLGTIAILARGQYGLLGLVDTGRVWVDGESAGGWHTGWGGGIWHEVAGQAVSAVVAQGERTQVYLSFGMPF